MKAIDRTDALRSLRRYLGALLDDFDAEFDVQYARAEPNPRPSAVVSAVGPLLSPGSAYVRHPQQEYTIFVYPSGEEGNALASKLEAERLADFLERAITAGGSHLGYAMRIPVYDHAGVAWDQDVAVDAVPYDWAPASNFQAQAMVDPAQDDLYNVIVDVRLSWEAAGDVRRFQGPPLDNIQIQHVEPPAGP